MLRIQKVYLETTIFNFPFVDDAPQYKSDTLKLFAEIKAGKYKAFTSEYVMQELEKTKDTKKLEQMKALITDFEITVLPVSEEIENLATAYVSGSIIPERYDMDALHIAVATVAGMDLIVSLNFKNIVKHKTIVQTEIINAREGYKRVFIHTPAEVIDHEENT